MGIITRKNEAQPRIVQVKAKHFNSLKVAIAAVLIIVMVLMTAIVAFKHTIVQQKQENSRLQSQVATLQGQIEKESQDAAAYQCRKRRQPQQSGVLFAGYTGQA
jgi:cell division protein FtsL